MKFYNTIFQKLWDGLKNNGVYVININCDIYEKYLKKLLGDACEIIELKKSTRNKLYKEYIYVWVKQI